MRPTKPTAGDCAPPAVVVITSGCPSDASDDSAPRRVGPSIADDLLLNWHRLAAEAKRLQARRAEDRRSAWYQRRKARRAR